MQTPPERERFCGVFDVLTLTTVPFQYSRSSQIDGKRAQKGVPIILASGSLSAARRLHKQLCAGPWTAEPAMFCGYDFQSQQALATSQSLLRGVACPLLKVQPRALELAAYELLSIVFCTVTHPAFRSPGRDICWHWVQSACILADLVPTQLLLILQSRLGPALDRRGPHSSGRVLNPAIQGPAQVLLQRI